MLFIDDTRQRCKFCLQLTPLKMLPPTSFSWQSLTSDLEFKYCVPRTGIWHFPPWPRLYCFVPCWLLCSMLIRCIWLDQRLFFIFLPNLEWANCSWIFPSRSGFPLLHILPDGWVSFREEFSIIIYHLILMAYGPTPPAICRNRGMG